MKIAFSAWFATSHYRSSTRKWSGTTSLPARELHTLSDSASDTSIYSVHPLARCALRQLLLCFTSFLHKKVSFLHTKGFTGTLCFQTEGKSVPQFSSVQSLSRVWLFATPWIAARQASPSITNSRSSLRLTSIQSVTPSSHLILCRPLLLLPPIPPSIRVFSNESTLHTRWPKYWSFASASFLPKKSQGWSPSEWTGWISLQSKGLSRVFSNTTVPM